ncbi:hypothetical protein HWV62_19103 [Athelia sp. TMB]|nr:hypothetical protein HWV62_19103 [Athelia sp. TMB]
MIAGHAYVPMHPSNSGAPQEGIFGTRLFLRLTTPPSLAACFILIFLDTARDQRRAMGIRRGASKPFSHPQTLEIYLDRMLNDGRGAADVMYLDQVSAYIMVAITVLFVHEWMLCVDDEVEICMRKGINAPIMTYVLARFMYTTQPSVHTDGGNLYISGWVISVSVVSSVVWWICSALTSLLFFFRVLAVFKHSRTKKVAFSVLWGLTGCVTLPLVYMVTGPALPASVCKAYNGESKPSVMMTSCPERPSLAMTLLILVAAHNILVFICISHELLGSNTLAGVCNMRTVITGNGLLPVSKSLLRSGQLYVR